MPFFPVAAAAVLLLDTNFVTEFVREHASRRSSPAKALLRSHPGRQAVISLVTVAEYLEYAGAPEGAVDFLQGFSMVGLGLDIARRCALLQARLPRRLGENDAWLAATALHHDFTLVTADRDFDRVPRLKRLRL